MNKSFINRELNCS